MDTNSPNMIAFWGAYTAREDTILPYSSMAIIVPWFHATYRQITIRLSDWQNRYANIILYPVRTVLGNIYYMRFYVFLFAVHFSAALFLFNYSLGF